MNLRKRLENSPSTLSDLALAAEQRYWDGIQLVTEGRNTAGIYWLGFAVEMWLKFAALRFDGLMPGSIWNLGSFKPAEKFLKTIEPGSFVAAESWHSVRFWSVYLLRRRSYAGSTLPDALHRALIHRTNRLYAVWWVSMRYHPDQADAFDVRRAYDDASWFRANFEALWR